MGSVPISQLPEGSHTSFLSSDYMKARRIVPELMDDPRLPAEEHIHALDGLARLNRWSWSDAGLWAVLRQEAIAIAPRSLRVLDLATGSGDVPISLAHRAARAGVKLELAGCDISENALAVASTKAGDANLHFFRHDVRSEPLPTDYDVIVTSLFLHHLANVDAVAVLRAMAAATTRMVVVNDLNRNRFNLALVHVAGRILTRSHIVHHDGPASMRAAFTIPEAKALAAEAGLNGATIRTQFPCRWLLTWRKS